MRVAITRIAAFALSGVLVITLLGGCTGLRPKLEPPALTVVGAEFLRGDLFEQRLKLRMQVDNPNAQEIAVRGISYTIELEGEELGRGISGSSFVVPANGRAEFDMLITANLAASVLRLAERSRASGAMPKEVRYRLRGEVRLDKSFLRQVPFDQAGSLKLR
jgi:LEA14-like dessication related protein